MSATINIDLFSNYFNQAPIVMVPGRLFPIQVEYFPIEDEPRSKDKDEKATETKENEKDSKDGKLKYAVLAKKKINTKPYLKVLERIDQQYPQSERGDMLIFVR